MIKNNFLEKMTRKAILTQKFEKQKAIYNKKLKEDKLTKEKLQQEEKERKEKERIDKLNEKENKRLAKINYLNQTTLFNQIKKQCIVIDTGHKEEFIKYNTNTNILFKYVKLTIADNTCQAIYLTKRGPNMDHFKNKNQVAYLKTICRVLDIGSRHNKKYFMTITDDIILDPSFEYKFKNLNLPTNFNIMRLYTDSFNNLDNPNDYVASKIRITGSKIAIYKSSYVKSTLLPYCKKLIFNYEYIFHRIPKSYILTKKMFVDNPKKMFVDKPKKMFVDKPKFDVTIFSSLFNCDIYIDNYLSCLKNLKDFESHKMIIWNIIDSNSDVTNKKIKEFCSIRNNILLLGKTKNEDTGLYDSWNSMLDMIDTELVCNYNADDKLHPDYLVDYVNEFKKNPHLNLVFSPLRLSRNINDSFSSKLPYQFSTKMIFYNSNENVGNIDPEHMNLEYKMKICEDYKNFKINVSKKRVQYKNLTIFDFFNNNGDILKMDDWSPCNLVGCAPMWKKSLYDKYGGFNENEYKAAADFDLWMRFFSNEGNFKKLDKSYVMYYRNTNSYFHRENHDDVHKKLVNKFINIKYLKEINVLNNQINRFGKKKNFMINDINYFMRYNVNFGKYLYGWNNVYSNLVKFLEDKKFYNLKKPLFIHPWLDCYNSWGKKYIENSLLDSNIDFDLICFQHLAMTCRKDENDFSPFLDNLNLISKIKILFVLSEEQKNKIIDYCPNLKCKIINIKHPIEINTDKQFDLNILSKSKINILHIGKHQRNVNSFNDNFNNNKFNKILVGNYNEKKGSITYLKNLNNNDYINLLTNSVVFVDLISSTANNLILECIKLNVPIIINKLPSVAEYLGDGYPLFYNSKKELEDLICNFEHFKQYCVIATNYLSNINKDDLTQNYFNKIVFKEINEINNVNNVKLTFVTTCFNRFWQLEQVYFNNIKKYSNNKNVKFILGDFNGDDSNKIEEYINRNFPTEIISGKLKYFKRKNKWEVFNMSKAKNFVSSNVDNDSIIYNLDGDNILIGDEYDVINDLYNKYGERIIIQMNDGPPNVCSKWLNSKLNIKLFNNEELIDDNKIIWNGTSGRVIISKKYFNILNGYPEKFKKLSLEEIFFILNAIKFGLKYIHKNNSQKELFIHQEREEDYQKNTAINLKLFYEILNKKNYYVNPEISETKKQFRLIKKKYYLTCFTILYKVDKFIDNYLSDLLNLNLFQNIYFDLYLFPETNTYKTNLKINFLKKFKNIKITEISLSDDKGLYYFWNNAIKNCKTNFISSFNPDDLRGIKWANELLSNISPNLFVICPNTIPYYDLNKKYRNLYNNNNWFGSRLNLDENNELKKMCISKENLKIEDLFQINNNKIETYNVPNTSPIWDITIHKKIGLFNEKKYGEYTDFVMWLNCIKNNFNIKLIDYYICFYISDSQYHKKTNDFDKFIKLINNYLPLKYIEFSKKQMFNCELTKSSFGKHHFYGWNWVVEEINKEFNSNDKGIILDPFVERTFNNEWEKDIGGENFIYSTYWIGIVHTTPKPSKLSESKNFINYYFGLSNFRESLKLCKGLICLGPSVKKYLNKTLKELNLKISVKMLKHPFPKINKSFNNNNIKNRINHVGFHLRNLKSFIDLKHINKRFLIPKLWEEMKKEWYIKNIIGKECYKNNILYENLNNIEYEKMCLNEIIFVDFYDVAGSNLISEAISFNTPIIINRLEQTEYYFGKNYPLFYNSLDEANELANNMIKIKSGTEYLKNLNKSDLDINNFIKEIKDFSYKIIMENV